MSLPDYQTYGGFERFLRTTPVGLVSFHFDSIASHVPEAVPTYFTDLYPRDFRFAHFELHPLLYSITIAPFLESVRPGAKTAHPMAMVGLYLFLGGVAGAQYEHEPRATLATFGLAFFLRDPALVDAPLSGQMIAKFAPLAALFIARRTAKLPPPSPPSDPYVVLGISHTSSMEDIARARREAIHKNHPDRVQGMDAEIIQLAHRRSVAINLAYETICAERRKKDPLR